MGPLYHQVGLNQPELSFVVRGTHSGNGPPPDSTEDPGESLGGNGRVRDSAPFSFARSIVRARVFHDESRLSAWLPDIGISQRSRT